MDIGAELVAPKTPVTREIELGVVAVVVIDDAQNAAKVNGSSLLSRWLRYGRLLPDTLMRASIVVVIDIVMHHAL